MRKPCWCCPWSRNTSSGNCSWTCGCLLLGYLHLVHPHCSSHSQGSRFACWVIGRSCSHCLLGRWEFHRTVHCVLGYRRFVWGWSVLGGSMHSAATPIVLCKSPHRASINWLRVICNRHIHYWPFADHGTANCHIQLAIMNQEDKASGP